jgi:hypothetical protein
MKEPRPSTCQVQPTHNSYSRVGIMHGVYLEEMAKVSVTRLPSYSTERFYLLSELEELCGELQVIYPELDDRDSSTESEIPSTLLTEKYWLSKIDNSTNKEEKEEKDSQSISLIYIIWKESDGLPRLMKSIELTLGTMEFNSSLPSSASSASVSSSPLVNRIIAVEILLKEKGVWTAEQETFFIETLTKFANKYSSLQFLFGLSDDYASPALEALLHTATELHKQQQKCSLITSHTSNYLGHNQDAEPDAISDVFQVLLVLQPPPPPLGDSQSQQTDRLKLPSHEIPQMVPSPQRFDLIRSQGVLFLLVAALSYILFAYFNQTTSSP